MESWLPPANYICWKENYDRIPKEDMKNYLDKVGNAGPDSDGKLGMI